MGATVRIYVRTETCGKYNLGDEGLTQRKGKRRDRETERIKMLCSGERGNSYCESGDGTYVGIDHYSNVSRAIKPANIALSLSLSPTPNRNPSRLDLFRLSVRNPIFCLRFTDFDSIKGKTERATTPSLHWRGRPAVRVFLRFPHKITSYIALDERIFFSPPNYVNTHIEILDTQLWGRHKEGSVFSRSFLSPLRSIFLKGENRNQVPIKLAIILYVRTIFTRYENCCVVRVTLLSI